MTQQSIIPGSLSAIAQKAGKSLAESFLSCDIVILIDTSGSMHANDSRGGQTRYSVACQELANLQNNLPGKIAVLAFSDQTQFCPSGLPYFFGGGTDMAGALKFAKVADVTGMQFILISDGCPNDPQATLNVARTYKNKINTIYVGPPDDLAGQDFLSRLAKASGGQAINADRAKELASSIQTLLLKG